MSFNINMEELKTDPVRIVAPRVQLIGHTHYIPPFDVDSEDRGKLQLPPQEFATESESIIEFAGRNCYRSWKRSNPSTAEIDDYLANIITKKHLSVLRHATATFYITGVSRAFSHEMVTHAHLARSQESQRYVDASKINAVLPPLIREWRGIRNAQGDYRPSEFSEMVRFTRNTYSKLVGIFEQAGIGGKKAREAARAVLPNCVETRMTVTGNFQAWLEFLTKRENEHADAEFQIVAHMIWDRLCGLAPNIFEPKVRKIWDDQFALREEAERIGAWKSAQEIGEQLEIPRVEFDSIANAITGNHDEAEELYKRYSILQTVNRKLDDQNWTNEEIASKLYMKLDSVPALRRGKVSQFKLPFLESIQERLEVAIRGYHAE